VLQYATVYLNKAHVKYSTTVFVQYTSTNQNWNTALQYAAETLNNFHVKLQYYSILQQFTHNNMVLQDDTVFLNTSH